jgi:hypothetical protein
MMRILPKLDRDYGHDLVILEDPRIVVEKEEEWDILYFIKCLDKDRGSFYQDCGKPKNGRPDRLFNDPKTGHQLAVEHTILYSSERDQKELSYEIKKRSFSSGYNCSSPEELATRLNQIIEIKYHRNQCDKYPGAEKILLIRNRWVFETDIQLFHECTHYLNIPTSSEYNHCFILLVTGIVLEIF